ncbi:MAG: radical SAM protein [Candidatus Moranbacteria bacterium]|nr:radical SAM protein [Candidatus Moranbacteria bacterium]
MKIRGIQLINTFGFGRSVNEQIYAPIGLIRIGMALKRAFSYEKDVSTTDEHHTEISISPDSNVVGFYANTLTYPRVLEAALKAKQAGKIVVLGGPHAILRDLILRNQKEVIDFVIEGKGEIPIVQLVEALEGNRSFENVYSLSWRRGNEIINNPLMPVHLWDWEEYCPPDYELLVTGIRPYHKAFARIHREEVGKIFHTFTHFGCRYKEAMKKRERQSCIFCSLCDPLRVRKPMEILAEIKYYLDRYAQKGDEVVIKDYGDDVGGRPRLVYKLLRAIEKCEWWNNYKISLTFYCRSSELTDPLAKAFQKLNASLFFGFDSADDEVLRKNGKGMKVKSHWRAIELCQTYNIPIQASLIAGLMGETHESLEANLKFAKKLKATGLVERFNSGMLIVLPGTPAFEMLAEKEPGLRDRDILTPDVTRALWHKHFTKKASVKDAEKCARIIDKMSPLHGSMGREEHND